MNITLRLVHDSVTPHLRKMAVGIRDKRPILEAMGLQLVSITKRAFNDASLRAAHWPPKKDGSPATLKKRGPLWQSIRIVSVSNSSVTIGSDRPYAAVHQLGSSKTSGRGSGIPARPFFPFNGRTMTPLAAEKIRRVLVAKVNALVKR